MAFFESPIELSGNEALDSLKVPARNRIKQLLSENEVVLNEDVGANDDYTAILGRLELSLAALLHTSATVAANAAVKSTNSKNILLNLKNASGQSIRANTIRWYQDYAKAHCEAATLFEPGLNLTADEYNGLRNPELTEISEQQLKTDRSGWNLTGVMTTYFDRSSNKVLSLIELLRKIDQEKQNIFVNPTDTALKKLARNIKKSATVLVAVYQGQVESLPVTLGKIDQDGNYSETTVSSLKPTPSSLDLEDLLYDIKFSSRLFRQAAETIGLETAGMLLSDDRSELLTKIRQPLKELHFICQQIAVTAYELELPRSDISMSIYKGKPILKEIHQTRRLLLLGECFRFFLNKTEDNYINSLMSTRNSHASTSIEHQEASKSLDLVTPLMKELFEITPQLFADVTAFENGIINTLTERVLASRTPHAS